MLGFEISKRPANREPSWEDSIRADEWIVHGVLFSWRLLHSNLLETRLPIGIDDGVSLVNMSSGSFDPSELRELSWLVVFTQIEGHGPVVLGSDSSAIADVDNVKVIIESHHKVAAASRFTVLHLLGCLVLCEYSINIILISHGGSLVNGRSHILREIRLQNDVIM